MSSKIKDVFLIFLTITLIIGIIVIFVRRNEPPCVGFSEDEYIESIRNLSDSIDVLQEKVSSYEDTVKKLSEEKEKIRKEMLLMLKQYEKTDSILANGTWDDNIRFLSDYLSKKDSL